MNALWLETEISFFNFDLTTSNRVEARRASIDFALHGSAPASHNWPFEPGCNSSGNESGTEPFDHSEATRRARALLAAATLGWELDR